MNHKRVDYDKKSWDYRNGTVGATITHGLMVQGTFDDYVLIDMNEAKVKADKLDLQDVAMNYSQWL